MRAALLCGARPPKIWAPLPSLGKAGRSVPPPVEGPPLLVISSESPVAPF